MVVSNDGESGGEGEDAGARPDEDADGQETLIRMMKETRINTGAALFSHVRDKLCKQS